MTPDHTVTPPWYVEHGQVLGFARILVSADALVTAADTIDYLAVPHTFDREHDLWTRSGRPHPPSTDDLAAARMLGRNSTQAITLQQQHQADASAWDAFCELLDDVDQTGRPVRLVTGRRGQGIRPGYRAPSV